MTEQLYDVVAVTMVPVNQNGAPLKKGHVRIIATNADRDDAEAVVKMAVMRRGCDEEIFAKVRAGRYSDGDKWEGKDK